MARKYVLITRKIWGHRGHDCMVVGFTTTYAISAYHHQRCKFESSSWQGVLDTTGTPVSSINKTEITK